MAAGLSWPDEGLLNPCLGPENERWLSHPVVSEALAGLDLSLLWDTHAHLMPAGSVAHLHAAPGSAGAVAQGPWPAPLMKLQAWFIANGACADGGSGGSGGPGDGYLSALLVRLRGLPASCKLVLLAMDDFHDSNGRVRPERTHFSVANDLCAQAAHAWPDRFEWAASVHPYRADASDELGRVKALGARAVKWIPAAQGIDPASARCDLMYRTLVALQLPLITHGGDERATAGDDALGNPLRLRRALDAGVRVIVAHCATMGEGVDLDRGASGPVLSNFALFARLMNEPRYESLLMGDLSAIGQMARTGPDLATLLRMGAQGAPWGRRLLFGTDYPIPAMMPLYSVKRLAELGFLEPHRVAPLRELRRHNAWLFDLVLKRHLRWDGQGFAPTVFETRPHLAASVV